MTEENAKPVEDPEPVHLVLDINDPDYDESLVPADVHAQKVAEKAAEDATL